MKGEFLAAAKSDAAYLKDLGARLAKLRLSRNMTQSALSLESGVSMPTLQRIEQGKSVQISNFIRTLRALKIVERLETLAPEIPPSPVQQAMLEGKLRRRASNRVASNKQLAPKWIWGDSKP